MREVISMSYDSSTSSLKPLMIEAWPDIYDEGDICQVQPRPIQLHLLEQKV